MEWIHINRHQEHTQLVRSVALRFERQWHPDSRHSFNVFHFLCILAWAMASRNTADIEIDFSDIIYFQNFVRNKNKNCANKNALKASLLDNLSLNYRQYIVKEVNKTWRWQFMRHKKRQWICQHNKLYQWRKPKIKKKKCCKICHLRCWIII